MGTQQNAQYSAKLGHFNVTVGLVHTLESRIQIEVSFLL